MTGVEAKFTKLFINNEWVDSKDGSKWSVINPTTEKEICKVSLAKQADVDLAVGAAKAAFEVDSEWRRMNASDRGRLLYKVADLIERDVEFFAKLETVNNGMPVTITTSSINGSVSMLRYFAGWADKDHGKVIPCDGDYFAYTRHEPVGVCAGIVPWNFPMSTLMSKVAPCLAMGNTMVVKPSEFTPLTALHTASLFKEAGFPPGVLNVVTGTGPETGNALSHHMDVDKISFTGSLAAGRLVMKAAADSNLKKITLELGGKSPLIVFSDVDLNVAAAQAHFGIMTNSGQICCAPSRVFVHEDVYDDFVKKSVAMAESRTLGDPLNPKNMQGPQVSKIQLDRVLGFIERGKKEGVTIKCGGKRLEGKDGYFIEPTVVTDITDDMEISRDEVFGPVQNIYKFKDVGEVLKRANNTYFGLAAAIMTNDINKYLAVANSLKAGTIWVNCMLNIASSVPFGGFKQSGIGRENGEYALREYTEVKSVYVKQPAGIKCLL